MRKLLSKEIEKVNVSNLNNVRSFPVSRFFIPSTWDGKRLARDFNVECGIPLSVCFFRFIPNPSMREKEDEKGRKRNGIVRFSDGTRC